METTDLLSDRQVIIEYSVGIRTSVESVCNTNQVSLIFYNIVK